jgi:hypothetical protein
LLTFVRDSLTENLGLKALAMAFALGLFAFVHGQEEEQQRTVPVPLVMRLPLTTSERELMTPIPASIHVTLQGSARAIDNLLQAGIPPVEIDLRDGRRESVVFDESMFTLPPETKITIIDPSSIELTWEDVATRQIPIQAAITGQPADGYVVKGEPEVDPKTVTVSGPVSAIEVLQFARLSAFARSRCSAMSARNPASSTVTPCSAAISSVRSIGKPYVSCSAKARSAVRVEPPCSFVVRTAVSRIVVPDARVRRNASSSPTSVELIRSKSRSSSG